MTHTKFHNLLCSYFNTNELQTLCFDLSINYENLPGNTLQDKARELITFCYRYKQIEPLVNHCRQLRPIISWPNAQEVNDALETPFTDDFSNSTSPSTLSQSIHGGYNAVSGHGGNSTINVTNIHQTPVEDADTIFQRGVSLINSHVYEQAIETLHKTLTLAPTNPRIYFYLSLAQLKGSRPKLHKLSTIQIIENHLRKSIDLAPQFGQAYVLWALVKYDYYVMNSIREHPPSIDQLLRCDWSINRGEVNELKSHLNAPRNRVWEWLITL